MRKFSILPAVLGNLYEWYDFALYGYLSAVITQVFFPTITKETAFLFTFGIFALSFITRPLGGLLFGILGDKIGRKPALIVTISTMSLATLGIGLTPGYLAIGAYAPILLLFMRSLQSLAVSGEFTGTVTFIVEHAKPERRGFLSSFAMTSVYAGQLLGAIAGWLAATLLSKTALYHFGWRIPFLIAVLFGALIVILRFYADETPQFQQIQHQSYHHFDLKNRYKAMLHIIGIMCLPAVTGYIFVAYLPTLFTNSLHLSLSTALLVNGFSMGITMLYLPIAGYLGDRLGHRNMMLVGNISFLLLAYPIFWLFSAHTLTTALLGSMLFSFSIACINGNLPTTMATMMPTPVRYRGIGLAFNLGIMIFGGTAPFVSQLLINHFHTIYAIAGLIIMSALVSLPCMIRIKD